MNTPSLSARASAVSLRGYCTVLLAVAAILLGGGCQLAILGGSAYYLGAGFPVAVAGIQLWRGRASGVAAYCLLLLATIPWAVWESGLNAWALMPRIVAPAVLGLPLLLPVLRRG